MKPVRRARRFTPRLEGLETRALPSVAPPAELSENNASSWKAFSYDGKLATVSNDLTNVMVGSRSLRFTTQSAGITGLRLSSGSQAWNLSSYKQLEFWTLTDNKNAAGFEGAQPVVILSTPTGSFRYVPRNQSSLQKEGWDKHHVSLTGDAFWTRYVSGSPNLANVTGIEIQHNTHGAGFTIHFDGIRFTKTDAGVPGASVASTNVQAGIVSPRVLLYVFNPIMENLGGKRLNEAYRWSDPQQLVRTTLQDVQNASGQIYRPQIVETRIVDQHPYFVGGYQYTDQAYVTAHSNGNYYRGTFDYSRFLRETGLAARIDRGEIDEVWISAGPGSGLSEAIVAGDGAYWMRGSTVAAGDRAFPIMGVNNAGTVGDALLSFARRVEATMAHVYKPLANDTNNAWRKFTRLNKDAPGQGGVGTAETPVNGRWSGDYNSTTTVQSTARDWDKYPALSGAKSSINASAWVSSNDPKRDYLKWWLDRLPSVNGRATDGRLTNWWRYVGDLDTFKTQLDLHGSDGTGKVWIVGAQNNSTVKGMLDLRAEGVVDGVLGRVDLYVDGTYHSSDTLGPFTFRLDTSKLSGGKHSIQLRAFETQFGTEIRSETIYVNVAASNTAPTLYAIPPQYVNEGSTVTFLAKAYDPDAGQKLTYSLGSGAPAGAKIDPNTGVFTWLTSDGPSQNATVQIRVTDSGGLTTSQMVQIVVRNEPPRARLVANGTFRVGSSITFSIVDAFDPSATDRAAGYRYSFDWNNNGSFNDPGEIYNGTQSSASRVFTSPGTYTVHVRIQDKDWGGTSYRTTVTIASSSSGPGRVADLAPGTPSSAPTQLVAIGKTLYFVASTPSTGEELFKSDGTAKGTVLVKDIMPGSNGSLPRNLVNVNGVLYFTAQDPYGGVELWRSDGTAGGTRRVRDINPGVASSWPSKLTAHQGWLYFTAFTPNQGVELWRSNGTESGTTMVVDLMPGAASSAPDQLTSFGNNLAFVAGRADVGIELFMTNGSAGGTHLVRDVNPGKGSSFIAGMIHANGTLYFSAYTQSHGQELWKSNGTSGGTMLVKDIAPGNAGSSPTGMVALGNKIIFTANDPYVGAEPWVSDGTAGGTRILSDILPGLGSSAPTSMTVYNGVVYFSATHATQGVELWRSDGTAAGTRLVLDLQPGSASSTPQHLVVSGGYLWFSAWTSSKGFEVWRTDGTSSGTRSFSNLYSTARPSWPSNLVDVAGTVFFVGYEAGYGYELWSMNRG